MEQRGARVPPHHERFTMAIRKPCNRRLTVVIAVAATLVLGAGCTSQEPEGGAPRSEPKLSEIPVLEETTSLELPLDAYEATPEEQEKLSAAQGILVTQCMKRYGFDYVSPGQPAPRQGNSRLFGVVSAQEAEKYGYRNPHVADTPRKDRRAITALSDTGRLVLSGADGLDPNDMPKSQAEAEKARDTGQKVNGQALPVGGCVRESYLKLYAPEANTVDMLFVFNLEAEADSSAREDSRVRANSKSWAACMKKAGYSVTDPMDAAEELGFEGDELGSPRAISAARSDVACKQEVNLVGVRFTVLSAYEERLIEQHAETLELARRQHQGRMKMAAELLD